MNRFYALILPVVMGVGLVSCDDDDSLPPVDVNVEISGATRFQNQLYVVSGDTIRVDAVNLVDNTTKGAVIGVVNYYFDYYFLGATAVQPYAIDIPTDGLAIGTHLLQANMSIYAVDYSPCVASFASKVVVVASADDLPQNEGVDAKPIIDATIRYE
jgi:hypothetical protein